MSKKNKPDNKGFVFSTDPNFRFDDEEQNEQETLPPAQQNLRVKLETKHRAGKTVTLIDGFVGTGEDAEKLGKQLKNQCGSGGSVKDREIIVQGDHREKVLQFLLKNGYSKTKKAG
jgi:translation initiation factor 1